MSYMTGPAVGTGDDIFKPLKEYAFVGLIAAIGIWGLLKK